jgi:hypothetical protein
MAASTIPATPSQSSIPSSLPSPASSRSPSAQVLGQGTVALEGNGTTYDHDAVNVGWKSLTHQPRVTQNATPRPTGNEGTRIIGVAGSPYTDVVLTGARPWTSPDYANAPYGANPSTTGTNALICASPKAGEDICVETQDASAKSHGYHLVLLVIKPVTSTAVTVAVTVGAAR